LQGDTENHHQAEEQAQSLPRSFDEVLIRVGGTLFSLDQQTIDNFGSDFLTKLVDPETHFKKPSDGIYIVDACPENFAAFVHMVRYGSIPHSMVADKEKETKMIQEARFWGIEGKVLDVTGKTKAQSKVSKSILSEAVELSRSLELSKVHHYFRKNDEDERIYCALCGNRDIDGHFLHGEYYAECKLCEKKIEYPTDLDWCHKCQMCDGCQTTSCPSDDRMSCSYFLYFTHDYPRPKSTKELEKDLEEYLAKNTF
jgi:BTB/POZ domain